MLRQTIHRLEGGGGVGQADAWSTVPFGHAGADRATGGIACGALHDVVPAGAPDLAAATGFALSMAARLLGTRPTGRRPLWLWIRQDMARREAGEPYGPGLAGLGLDPAGLVSVLATDTEDVLRAAEEGLKARVFAAVLIEPWGNDKALDLTATRRLALIAGETGATGLLLRSGGMEMPGSVATRWCIRAAPSRTPAGGHPGAPVYDAELTRNRRGMTGRWSMEWNCDDRRFEPASADQGRALSRRLAAGPGDRAAPPARQETGAVIAFR